MGTKRDYEELRDSCIADFKKVYKDSIVFDMNECSQEERTLLSQDPEYLKKTKSYKAKLYAENLGYYNRVLQDEFGDEDKTISPADVMKAVEARNKILFSDLNIDADDANSINIMMTFLSKEEMEKITNVTAFTNGEANARLDGGLVLPDGTVFGAEEKDTEEAKETEACE